MEFRHLPPADFPTAPCALQQSNGYARALTEMGVTTESLIVRDGPSTIARMLILRRRFGPVRVCWLPRGPVWIDNPTIVQRARVLRGLPAALPGRAMWILSPDRQEDLQHVPHTALMTPQYVAEIDLTHPRDARLARQHGKWRNRLRHARSAGLRVTHRPFAATRDMDLLTREAAQRADRRYAALPPEFVLAWAHGNPKDSRLFTISKGGAAIAQMLVLLHAPVATYHIGWTGPEGRRLSAHNLALWEAANWLADRGYTRFDLGSVDTRNSPGLARFKIGSGATIRPLGPTGLRLPRLRRNGRISDNVA